MVRFQVAEHIRCWDDFKRVKLSYIETLFGGASLNEYASDMNILMSCTYEKLFDEVSMQQSQSLVLR